MAVFDAPLRRAPGWISRDPADLPPPPASPPSCGPSGRRRLHGGRGEVRRDGGALRAGGRSPASTSPRRAAIRNLPMSLDARTGQSPEVRDLEDLVSVFRRNERP